MTEDETPAGDPIETHTLWLQFPEGDGAISLDLTGWNAAIRAAAERLPRGEYGPTADYGDD